jgi:hypothetical protein
MMVQLQGRCEVVCGIWASVGVTWSVSHLYTWAWPIDDIEVLPDSITAHGEVPVKCAGEKPEGETRPSLLDCQTPHMRLGLLLAAVKEFFLS